MIIAGLVLIILGLLVWNWELRLDLKATRLERQAYREKAFPEFYQNVR